MFWKQFQERHGTVADNADISEEIVSQLNPEQRFVYDMFTQHLQDCLDPTKTNPAQLLVQVDGQGGTGKSFVINALSTKLNYPSPGCVAKAAPTGIAANAINGMTLHRLLHLPVSRSVILTTLSHTELANMQATL